MLVFFYPHIVGVAGARREIFVIFTTRIDIAKDDCDRSAQSFSVKDSTEDLWQVGFLTSRNNRRRTRTATGKTLEQKLLIPGHARGRSLNEDSQRNAMTLAKACDFKKMSEAITRHSCSRIPSESALVYGTFFRLKESEL